MLLDEAQLLSQSRIDRRKAGGPGGQKRNKTSSTVRITHLPSGISVMAGESRSLKVNQARAVARLRHRLVIRLRLPLPSPFPPQWLVEAMSPGVYVSPRDQRYLPMLQLLLDALDASAYSIRDAAALLGVTAGRLVSLVQADSEALAEVNQRRAEQSLVKLGR